MADNNNHRVGNLPKVPNPELKKLDRLIGSWQGSGATNGLVTYEWMEGGFFLVQHFDYDGVGGKMKGVSYIGFDEDTQTLRSHLMDSLGHNFTYTWDISGDTVTIWFGEKDSDNFFSGKFSEDGNTIAGRWQWPEVDGKIGGFEDISTRLKTHASK